MDNIPILAPRLAEIPYSWTIPVEISTVVLALNCSKRVYTYSSAGLSRSKTRMQSIPIPGFQVFINIRVPHTSLITSHFDCMDFVWKCGPPEIPGFMIFSDHFSWLKFHCGVYTQFEQTHILLHTLPYILDHEFTTWQDGVDTPNSHFTCNHWWPAKRTWKNPITSHYIKKSHGISSWSLLFKSLEYPVGFIQKLVYQHQNILGFCWLTGICWLTYQD